MPRGIYSSEGKTATQKRKHISHTPEQAPPFLLSLLKNRLTQPPVSFLPSPGGLWLRRRRPRQSAIPAPPAPAIREGILLRSTHPLSPSLFVFSFHPASMMVAEEGEEGDAIEVPTRTEEGESGEGGCEIAVSLAIGAVRLRTSLRWCRSTPP